MTDATTTRIWSILSDAFQSILGTLQKTLPEARVTTGHSHNDWFPFRAYAEYTNSDNVVVLTLDLHLKDTQVNATGDICREDGYVVKNLLQTVIGVEPCDAQLLVAQVTALAWQFREQVGLIADELTVNR